MNAAGFAFFDNFKTDSDFDKWYNEPVLNGTYDFSKGMIWNDSVSGLVAAKPVKNLSYESLYKISCEKHIELNDIITFAELGKMYVF